MKNELVSRVSRELIPDTLSYYEADFEAQQDFRKIAAFISLKRSPHTKRAYSSDLKRFLNLVRKPLREIDTEDLAAYLLSFEGKSNSSKKRAKDSISSLFRYLTKTRYISFSPAEALDPIRVEDQTMRRSLSFEVIKRAIESEPNPRNKLLIDLLFVSGIRRSEAQKLRFDSFVKREKSVQMIVSGKGGKVRSVHLPLRFWAEIESVKFDREAQSSECLFVSNRADRLSVEMLNLIVKSSFRRVGVEGVSAHWLRHSHATVCLGRGVGLSVLQKTLGHQSLTTTQKYLHVSSEESSGMALE